MKKRFVIIVPLIIFVLIYLVFGFGRSGSEKGFKAKILSIDDNIIFAETLEDDAGFLSPHLSKKFYFELDMIPETASDLMEGDIIYGTYVEVKGNVAKVAEVRLSDENERLWDKIPSVMVNGVLYFDTGKETDKYPTCGVMDGEITSTAESWQMPQRDDQSNFGVGYSYQYGTEDTIIVLINEKWIVFKAEK